MYKHIDVCIFLGDEPPPLCAPYSTDEEINNLRISTAKDNQWGGVVMAAKLIPKGKEKDRGEGKPKSNAHWMASNKKLFMDLALKEKVKGNRPRQGL